MSRSVLHARATALRALFNRWRRRLLHAWGHRIVFGERSQGRLLAHTRIAPSTCLQGEAGLRLADHVFIGPFCFIDAAGGVTLDEGVQVTHHVSIVTHSSHRAQRLLGATYTGATAPLAGWQAGPVQVGPYCFIGPHSLLEANTRLGRGCIVRAGSVLRGTYPDFAVIAGNPARVVGDSREGDTAWLARHPECRPHYEAWAGHDGAGAAPAPSERA